MNRSIITTISLFLFTALTAGAQIKQNITKLNNGYIEKEENPEQSSFYPVVMGDRFVIDKSNDGKERQFPFVYKFGDNIFVSYSEHPDAVIASPEDAMMISRDNGKTWKEKITNKDFYFTSMFKKDGVLYGIVYFTYPKSQEQEGMRYWTSADDGKTWIKHEGVVNTSESMEFVKNGNRQKGIWGSMLFHRGMIVMEDGSIQGVMYGHMAGDKKYRVVWVKSIDNCKTWEIVSTIASGIPEYDGKEYKKVEGYCEPNVIRVQDGSLLCVMRIGSYNPLFQSRSTDNGLTWSRPVTLPGLPDSISESVDPNLLLMEDGTLALSYGRPGDKIAFSTDGSGYNWDVYLNTYEGVTTGYTGIVEITPGKLLFIADQGANWHKGDNEKVIWGRFIHIVHKEEIKE